MDMGEMRRAPRLWEQQLADTLGYVAPGGETASGPVNDGVLSDSETAPEPDPTVPTDLPTPSVPTWRSGIAMIVVTWNGLTSTGEPWPVDTKSWVEAHVSPTPNFTPSKTTNQGVFFQGAGDVPSTALKADTDYWVKLLGRDELGGVTVSAEVKAHTGLIMDTDIGKGAITADKVSFNARQIGGITTGIGTSLPTDAKEDDIFLLKVRNPEGGVEALVQYQFSNGVWNKVEWGAASLSAKCITAQQITAGAIVAGAIAADAVLAGNIKAGEITADKIAVGTITAQSACIQSLDAGKITVGFLSADRIRGGKITGSAIQTPGQNGSYIVMGDPGDGGSDFIRFYNGGDLSGQIRGMSDGIQIGGLGPGDAVWIDGDQGLRFRAGAVPVAAFGTGDRVVGINSLGRLVAFSSPPKADGDTPDAPGESVDDLRALVRDLQATVAELTGRVKQLEAR